MWVSPLQMAEDTKKCLGWLLYSANEYDCKELCKEICIFVSINVALRFREVDNGILWKDGTTCTSYQKLYTLKLIKGAQQGATTSWRNCILLWPPVPSQDKNEVSQGPQANTKAKAKSASLRANQQCFLSNMETCITWELSTLDLVDSTIGANLHQLIMNIPDLERPGERLFHVVNKMLHHDGYIFWFNPNCSQSARETVASLLVYLQGMWTPMVEWAKFNKFFTGLVIEWAADAWWDMKKWCIITKANAKLEDLINQDINLMFPEDAVTVDLTQVQQETHVDVWMSTGSISMFCTTATPQVKARVKSSNKCDNTRTPQASVDQASILTGMSMSKVDFNVLMMHIAEALQINTQLPPSGLETGKPSWNIMAPG